MKRRVLIPLATASVLLIVIVPSLGQERTQIKVKNSEVVTGVVVIDVLRNGLPFELQCNAGAYLCQPLKNGTYILVELPEHFGMYECRNVEVYSGSSTDLQKMDVDKTDKLGEYCLIEK